MAACGATNITDKSACKNGNAKDSLASLLGKAKDKVTNTELESFVRKAAKGQIGDTISACMDSAAGNRTLEAKCKNSNDIKDSLKVSLGKENVTLTNVMQFVHKAASSQAQSMMEACISAAGDMTEATVQACKNSTKGDVAKALGLNEADMKPAKFEKFMKRASKDAVGETMKACMTSSDGNLTKCMASVKESMSQFNNNKPIHEAIDNSAVSEQADNFKACAESGGTQQECNNMTTLIIAATQLKANPNISEDDVRQMTAKGVEQDTADFAAACMEATDNGEAGACDMTTLVKSADLAQGIPQTSRRAKSKGTKDRETVNKGMTRMIEEISESASEVLNSTTGKKPDKGSPDLLAMVKEEAQGPLTAAAGAQNASRIKVYQDKGATKRLGKYMQGCMKGEGATNATCTEGIKDMAGAKMNSTDIKDAMRKCQADSYDSVEICDDATACIQSATTNAGRCQGINKAKKGYQRLNAARKAIEAIVACKDAQGTSQQCDTEGKEAFIGAGAKASNWNKTRSGKAGTIEQMVRTAAISQINGVDTKIVMEKNITLDLDVAVACTEIDDGSTKESVQTEVRAAINNSKLEVAFEEKTDTSTRRAAQCAISLKVNGMDALSIDQIADIATNIPETLTAKSTATRRADVSASAYSAQDSSECPESGCFIAAVASVPTAAPTAAVPTAAPTAAGPAIPAGGTKVVQVFSFTALSLSDWTPDTQAVYETAFGINIGIYDETAKAYKAGCSVTSTASRRALAVSFTAVASAAQAATARTAAQSADGATSFAANVAKANTALGKSVAVPSAADISAQPAVTTDAVVPTPTPTTTTTTSSGGIVIIIIIVVVSVVVVLGIVGIVVYASGMCQPAQPALAAKTEGPSDDDKVGVTISDPTSGNVPQVEMSETVKPAQ